MSIDIEELKRRLKSLREANPRTPAEYVQSYRRAVDYMLVNADAIVARLEAAQGLRDAAYHGKPLRELVNEFDAAFDKEQ